MTDTRTTAEYSVPACEEIQYNTPLGGNVLEPAHDNEVTQALRQIEAGDAEARERLFQMIFPKLLAMASARMRSERPGQSLTARDLVHEAYLRVAQQATPQKNRSHLYALFAIMMRRVLVDRAKRKAAGVHGGDWIRITFDPDLPLAAKEAETAVLIHQSLERLEREDKRQATIVELRYFGGLTNEEAAEKLGVGLSTVENDWRFAKAWLRTQLEDGR